MRTRGYYKSSPTRSQISPTVGSMTWPLSEVTVRGLGQIMKVLPGSQGQSIFAPGEISMNDQAKVHTGFDSRIASTCL